MDSVLPSELLELAREGVNFSYVAADTESNGLYQDDGARISTASIAWQTAPHWLGYDQFKRWGEEGRLLVDKEEWAPDQFAEIASISWPFNQGWDGKPESGGQIGLWPDAENLDRSEWEALLELLQRFPLVMHNMLHDVLMFRAGVDRGGWRSCVDLSTRVAWDTMAVANLIWPTKPIGLDDIGNRLWDKRKKDPQKLKKWLQKHKIKLKEGRYDLVPWDIMGPYAGQDARLTIMAFLRQVWEIRGQGAADWLGDAEGVIKAIDRRKSYVGVCIRMEQKGVPYDEVQSKIAGIECLRRAGEIAKQLPFKPPTDAKAKEYWFSDKPGCLDLTPYAASAKTGAPSLTAEIVQRMVTDGVEHADTWADYNKVTNAASMWYIGYSDKTGPDGRLRTRFKPFGARSSRSSVERVNLQAIPADYRLSGYASLDGLPTPRQLIAAAVPEGWGIWELDLAQAELRVAALYAQCERMLKMMAAGEDLHTFTTQELFGLVPGDDDFPKYRQVGKRGNFSLCFGSGWETFAGMVSKETGIRLPPREASRVVRDWNELYPEFHRAIDRHMEQVIRRQNRYGSGWVQVGNGERRWWQRGEDAHKAFNQRVQTSLAQFGIDWMLETDSYLADDDELEEMGGGLVLTIHDSQALLLPLDRGQEIADRCAGFATYLWKDWFPGVGGWAEAKQWRLAA